jgi:predicted RNA-binding Zn ribbon-like protein
VDLAAYTELAVRLVNSGVPAETDCDALATVEAYRGLVTDRPHLCGGVTPTDLEALRLLRAELRLIFEAASAGREAEVADRLNALLSRYPVHPYIVRHDGQPWHIHLVNSGSVADRHAAGAVAGLTRLVTDCGTDRLGVCAGTGCQRVFADHGPGRPRRYCSEACASRANVRALRSRGRGGGQHPAPAAAS